MEAKSQRPNEREAIPALNAAIEAVNLAEKTPDITPAKAVFGSVTILLTMIRVCLLLFYNDSLQIYTRPGLGLTG